MKKKRTRHHLKPKARGGTAKDGILYLWADRHHFWHALFGEQFLIETLIKDLSDTEAAQA